MELMRTRPASLDVTNKALRSKAGPLCCGGFYFSSFCFMDMDVDEKAGLLHRQGCEAACWRINVLLFDKRFDELLLPVASRARRLFRRCHVDESAKRAGGGERILWQWRAAQAYRHRSCLWLPAGQFVRQQGQGQSLGMGLLAGLKPVQQLAQDAARAIS